MNAISNYNLMITVWFKIPRSPWSRF